MESMRAQKSVTGVFSMCHVCMLSCAALISEVIFMKLSLFCCLLFVHTYLSLTCNLGSSNKVILSQNKTTKNNTYLHHVHSLPYTC